MSPLTVTSSMLNAFCFAVAQNIIVPPIFDHRTLQHSLSGVNDEIDISTGSQFNGLTTFANLPYINCFVDEDIEAYDIAILGSPFDTVSAALQRGN